MINKYLNVIVGLFIIFLMFGCERGPYDISIVCKATSDNHTLEFVRYKFDTYHWNPHVAGNFDVAGVRYIRDGIIDDEFWLLEKMSSDIEFYSDEICKKTVLGKNITIMYPIASRTYLGKDVIEKSIIGTSLPENLFIINIKNNKKFILRGVPDQGPPYLVGKKDDILNTKAWSTSKIIYKDGVLMAKQISFLEKPFLVKESEGDSFIRSLYFEGRGVGCKDCMPVFVRTMISTDSGITWNMKEYEQLNHSSYAGEVKIKIE